MQIHVTRSGGFAGTLGDFEVDTSQLEAPGRELERIVGELGFLAQAPSDAVGADFEHYVVRVRDAAREAVVEFSDDGSPDKQPLLKLVNLVQQSATQSA